MLVSIKIVIAFFSLFSTYSQGTQLYEFMSHRCCDGTVHPLPDSESAYECCGEKLYKYGIQNDDSSDLVSRCCRNKLYEKVNVTTLCCGTKLYELTTQACYQWGENEFKVVTLTDDNVKNGEYKVCGKSNEKGECYNPNKKICCSGVSYDKVELKHCCGERYINTKVSKCCVDYVKDEKTKKYTKMTSVIHHNGVTPKKSKCCNGKIIDAEKQECCAGAAVDFSDGSNKNPFKSLYYDYSEDYSRDLSSDYATYDLLGLRYFACCGRELVTDKEMQVCVDNERLVNKENRNQVYCDGRLRNVSGGELLNVYCIKEEVLELKGNQMLCSVNGKKIVYDMTRQVCGDNVLSDRTVDDQGMDRRFACYKSRNGLYLSSTVSPDLVYKPPFDFQAEPNYQNQ